MLCDLNSQLTDLADLNHIAYDGFLIFRLWFYPIGDYQTCLGFWANFRVHIVFICNASPSNKEHVSAWVCCVWNHLKSLVVCDS